MSISKTSIRRLWSALFSDEAVAAASRELREDEIKRLSLDDRCGECNRRLIMGHSRFCPSLSPERLAEGASNE